MNLLYATSRPTAALLFIVLPGCATPDSAETVASSHFNAKKADAGLAPLNSSGQIPQGTFQAWTADCYPADKKPYDTALGGEPYTFSLVGIHNWRIILHSYPRIIWPRHDTASNEGYDMAWYEGTLLPQGDSIVLKLTRDWSVSRLRMLDKHGRPVT